MTDQKKPKLKYIIYGIIVLFILWLLLRNSKTAQQIVKQYAPWAAPLIGSTYGAPTYDINVGGYVPANMSNSKCDSNSPCVFCVIPNAAYPSPPVIMQNMNDLTDYVIAPQSNSWLQDSPSDNWILTARIG